MTRGSVPRALKGVARLNRRIGQLETRLAEAEIHAARYEWLRKTDPMNLCAIAYRVKAACHFDNPDEAIDAARAADNGPVITDTLPNRDKMVTDTLSIGLQSSPDGIQDRSERDAAIARELAGLDKAFPPHGRPADSAPECRHDVQPCDADLCVKCGMTEEQIEAKGECPHSYDSVFPDDVPSNVQVSWDRVKWVCKHCGEQR